MIARLTRRRLALGTGALAVSAVAWLLIAPTQLGGQLSYVVVHGGSMEPLLSDGDLAVVRSANSYGAGDAVAYESNELDRVVLHRILRAERDRFVVKGDANDWLDASRPGESDVVGLLWFSLPAIGTVVETLAEPLHAAVIAGALALLCLLGTGARVHRRRRRRFRTESPALVPAPKAQASLSPGRPSSILAAQALHVGLLLSACSLLLFVVLGLVAFTRPASHEASRKLAYTHGGAFTYSGITPAGPVYPDGRVSTGQPVFLRLVDRLDVRFEYGFGSEADFEVAGSADLVAKLTDGSGWTREVTLAPATSFAGPNVRLAGSLDLRGLRALIDRVEKATGVPRPSYTVSIVPEVRLAASLGGARVHDSFSPSLPFRFDAAQMQLEGAASDGGATPGLRPQTSGSTDLPVSAVSTFGLGRLRVEVPAARTIALYGVAIALTSLLALACMRLTGPRRGEPARIRAAYGHILIPLAAAPEGGAPTIEIASIGGLAQLARSAGRPLLAYDDGYGRHTYYVDDGTALYRYETASVEPSGGPATADTPTETMSEQEIPRDRLALVRRATERL